MVAERRICLKHALALLAAPWLASSCGRVMAQAQQPQVVKLVAQRFEYTPKEFRVEAGRPVVLEISSLDFVHGFHMPDLKLRADLPPGIVTRVRFTVDKPGIYEFLCDNFCGDHHEEMNARMVVDPPAS